MLLANLATLAAALFTGATAYTSLVEHPARLRCPTALAVEQWRPSYKRATVMQAPLAVAGSLLALAAWLSGAGLVWLPSGLLLGAVVPFTVLVMWPTNKRLEDAGLDMTGEPGARPPRSLGAPARRPIRAEPAGPDPDAVRPAVIPVLNRLGVRRAVRWSRSRP